MNAKGAQPGSQTSLRERNRLRVLDAVRDHGALTQVEIAGLTGLSAATVSNMVRELDGVGAVRLAPSIRNGRRATEVSLPARRGLLAAIVFGDRDVRVAIAADPDDVIGEKRMPLPSDHAADEGADRGSRLLADLLEASGHEFGDLRAVTVGVPAPVDTVSGQIGAEGILRNWRGVPVEQLMAHAVGMPVHLDNTANLAALGEARSGVLQGIDNGVYLKASYGVGAGLILDGALFRGSAGTAGEIGHTTIDEDGPVCRCGNRGCLDTFVGVEAVTSALRPTHGRLTLKDVIARALEGDPGCRRVLSDAGRYLGMAVAGLVNVLNPEVVALGGQLSRVGDLVLVPMRETVDRRAIPSAAASVRLVAAELSETADVVGALATGEVHRAAAERSAVVAG